MFKCASVCVDSPHDVFVDATLATLVKESCWILVFDG